MDAWICSVLKECSKALPRIQDASSSQVRCVHPFAQKNYPYQTPHVPLAFAGVLARANAVTTNNRVYDKVSMLLHGSVRYQPCCYPEQPPISIGIVQDTLVRDGERYIQNLVNAGGAFGELEHPHYNSPTFRHLHLATISHKARDTVTSLWSTTMTRSCMHSRL